MNHIMQQIGRYEVLRELGRGAMGVVYAAVDPLIGRLVAVKTIRLDNLATEDTRAELTRRLYREAQSAGILSHSGIIAVHDIGERRNLAYIVMEYVDGINFEEVLSSGIPQHSDTLLSILRQSAAALDYAHEKGIIHRDIKPSNLMICRDSSAKIADFGVAKLSASSSMTQNGLVLGTPSYMSPEQAQGLTIDGRSDQFSLAVVAYRALTGVLPFQGPTLTALLAKILMEEPHYESAGLHPYFQPVFERALAKDPQVRFPTCGEFVRNLESAYVLIKGEKPESTLQEGEHKAAASETGAASSAGNNPPEAGIALPSRAEDNAKKDASPPTFIPVESPQKPAAGKAESPPLSVSLPFAEPQGEAPKRKSGLIAWIAGLAVLVLAAIAFLAVKALQEPEQEEPAAIADKAPVVTDTSQIQPTEGPAVTPKLPRPDLNNADTEIAAAAKPNRVEASKESRPFASGTINWTGKLGKNAILVITSRNASIGSLTGELPGRPVSIQLEPSDLVVRQMPDKANNWKQIMLYSGSKKYTSITIRWKTTR
jgi:serine/threonine protein kinase